MLNPVQKAIRVMIVVDIILFIIAGLFNLDYFTEGWDKIGTVTETETQP